MHVSRSRLIAAAVVLLAVGGAVAARSLASGHRPAGARRTEALAQRTFVSAATGNDANPCTRAAPCRNFQAAIAQTTPGGEVVVLDSGGYGQVAITQAVSLVAPPGVYAGITVFSGAGVQVNAGSNDAVTLRGLTLNGLGANIGIDFGSGGALYVQDTVFKNLDSGISANLTPSGPLPAGAKVVVDDSLFSRSGTGAFLSSNPGAINATIEHCRFEDGFQGVTSSANANVEIRDSVATGNSSVGFYAQHSTSHMDVENSLLTHNATGLFSTATMLVSETTIEENTTGVGFGSNVTSFGNNRLADNTTNGTFSSTIPLQ